jgi:hypothetical protein
MDPSELAFLKDHPGFDHEQLATYFVTILQEYRDDRNLAPGETLVLFHLADGSCYPVAGVRAALTSILLITEDDGLVFVPYHQIRKIEAGRRPSDQAPPKNPVGFSFESI